MLAEDLKALNDSRKEMTERGVEEAVQMIESTSLKDDRVLVVYLPDCHESIGRHHRRADPREILQAYICAYPGGRGCQRFRALHRDLRYVRPDVQMPGTVYQVRAGHKLAAGLSLEEENVERFRETINELCELSDEDLQEKVSIDMRLPFPYITGTACK